MTENENGDRFIFLRKMNLSPFSSRRVPAAICIFLFVACSPSPAPLLRVGTNIWPGYETLYLARSLGAFDERRIRLIEFPSSVHVQDNLRNGTIEAGCLTLDETLSLLADGVDLRVILAMDISAGADVILARPGLGGLADLRGRRVGVESTNVGAVMLDAALQRAGLKTGDVTVVPLSVDEHETAYRNGAVDAVVTFEPVRSRLLSAGAHVIFDSSQVPDRILDVLVVRADKLAGRHDALLELVRGHFRALAHISRSPQDAATRMTPRLGAGPLEQFSGLRLPDLGANRTFLAGAAPPLRGAAAELGALLVRRGLLPHPVAVDKLADAGIVNAITP